MTNSQYNFKQFSHEELIKFALAIPPDLERAEHGQLIRELAKRLKIFKAVSDRF